MKMFKAFPAQSRSCEDCVEHFETSITNGLNESEANRRLDVVGPNELEKEKPVPMWKLVLEQFDDYLIKILLASAAFSFVLAIFQNNGEGITAFVEPFVILLILIINAVIGVWQENNAANALKALKEMQSESARCLRNGKWYHSLPASHLVPGDIVQIQVGDKVPADCRLLQLKTTTLRVEESALTGESKTIMKLPDVTVDQNAGPAEMVNMLFSGTMVTNGYAIAMVVRTGMDTEIGRIQQAVMEAKEEEEKTPLGQKIDEFGELLGKVIMWICVVVWVMNYKHFTDPEFGGFFRGCIYYLKVAVALGVAAIPEGLPAVITLCLSLGTRSMAKRNCIVRKLPSVETLGCTTVICSDKTGTLTTNEMCVVSLVNLGQDGHCVQHTVDGISYNPEGSISDLSSFDLSNIGLCNIAKVCSLCNEAGIEYDDSKMKYMAVGEPTEAALKVLVEKMGIPTSADVDHHAVNTMKKNPSTRCSVASRFWQDRYDILATLEFSRTRKSMSVICAPKNVTGRNVLFVKGAPENVLARCTSVCTENGTILPLTDELRQHYSSVIYGMSSKALRCLAMAGKLDLDDLSDYSGSHHPSHKKLLDINGFEEIESGLTFFGVVGIKDPARVEVRDSIQKCRQAGIRVFMITGDNQITAEAIARDVGIFDEDEDISQKSYLAKQFMQLSHDEQLHVLSGAGGRVFSRSEPVHKKQLISLLKQMGEITAMTGDGVNDAPALQQADIGVAMGISGTEVAKEASDMVLVDDNFSTIVAAIEEGRSIYQNMKAFIRYLISSNIGEVASIFFTAMLGIPEGLSPVQLLWVNLVTDGPPATALGFNPPEPDIMQKPPRDKDEGLITPFVFFRYMVIGLYVGFATVGIFVYWYVFDSAATDGHPLVTLHQLMNHSKCPTWTDFNLHGYGASFSSPCDYFEDRGKVIASTLSLTVLVTIEMFNSLNALSEECSLLVVPPHKNMYLVAAVIASFLAHFCILYIPPLASIFSVSPLSWREWKLVFWFSFPVIVIDEVLKFVGRMMDKKKNRSHVAEAVPLLKSFVWDFSGRMPKERTVHAKTYSAGPAPTGASGGLGQHFIKNIAVVHNIVEKAGIKPTDIVLEIGPGNGIMTMELLKKAKKVIAIELDPRMVNEVQKKVQGTEYANHLQIIHGDFLKVELPYFDLCVANVPYVISSGIVFKLLQHRPFFRAAVLMFQEEFTQRLCAKPGDNMYCRLSVNTQLLARTQQLLKVGRNNFNPPPKVESRVCRIEPYNPPPSVNFVEWDGMIRLCFQRKNKTLSAIFTNKKLLDTLRENYLTFCTMNNQVPEEQDMKEIVTMVLEETGFAGARASKMTIEDFMKLLNAFLEKGIHFA